MKNERRTDNWKMENEDLNLSSDYKSYICMSSFQSVEFKWRDVLVKCQDFSANGSNTTFILESSGLEMYIICVVGSGIRWVQISVKYGSTIYI